jgi:hypothetical protein
MCVYQEANGEDYLCLVRALGWRFLLICQYGGTAKRFLSLYWSKGTRADVTVENISRALTTAATELQYPTNKGIPIA